MQMFVDVNYVISTKHRSIDNMSVNSQIRNTTISIQCN